LETAASILHDYVTPAASSLTVMGSPVPVQTYSATRAELFEAQLRYTSRHFSSRAIFVWGQDLEADQPLAEIEPLTIESTLRSQLPFAGSHVWLRHTWAAAQRRISPDLAELATGAWNRVDLGLAASWKNAVLELEVDNLLDHAYNTHLAYSRNPFSAGTLVMEPGRTLRISLSVNG
jgi:outer membrane receptor protein involved in Fe transport